MSETTTASTYFRAMIGLRTLTPLHAGVLGGNYIIDRPIDREVNTQRPKVNSTALKGALREQSKASGQIKNELFGMEESEFDGKPKIKYGKAGLLSFTDARLLLFPLRSAKGGWAWVTCPSVLQRFRAEAALAGYDVEQQSVDEFYRVFDNALNDGAAYAGEKLRIGDKILLHHHELTIDARLNKNTIGGWQKEMPIISSLTDLAERLVVVSEENFTELTKLYTEVSTRNKINDATGATGGGALFTEEYLPEGALLYALSFSMPNATHDEIASKLDTTPKTLQLAGNATLGKGRCALEWHFLPKSQKHNS